MLMYDWKEARCVMFTYMHMCAGRIYMCVCVCTCHRFVCVCVCVFVCVCARANKLLKMEAILYISA